MDKELLFITVIGQDKKGIVARISGLLYESGVNIEDISQGIMEGYFVMTMAVDMRDANRHLETLSASLQRPGEEMR
jgi:ACT domain-containing protein